MISPSTLLLCHYYKKKAKNLSPFLVGPNETMKEYCNRMFNYWDKFIKKYNPCQWNSDRCYAMKPTEKSGTACCSNCNNNNGHGCTTRNLACKTFFCGKAYSKIKGKYDHAKLYDYHNIIYAYGFYHFETEEDVYARFSSDDDFRTCINDRVQLFINMYIEQSIEAKSIFRIKPPVWIQDIKYKIVCNRRKKKQKTNLKYLIEE